MSDAYTKPDDLPKVLPENPTGWTRDLVMHLNLGRRGGVASYPMVVIYERPADHPVGFVVRAWSVLPGKVIPAKLLGVDLPSIEAARELVPQGLVNVGRTDDDAACVVEAWC
jgi:hypothetical protein